MPKPKNRVSTINIIIPLILVVLSILYYYKDNPLSRDNWYFILIIIVFGLLYFLILIFIDRLLAYIMTKSVSISILLCVVFGTFLISISWIIISEIIKFTLSIFSITLSDGIMSSIFDFFGIIMASTIPILILLYSQKKHNEELTVERSLQTWPFIKISDSKQDYTIIENYMLDVCQFIKNAPIPEQYEVIEVHIVNVSSRLVRNLDVKLEYINIQLDNKLYDNNFELISRNTITPLTINEGIKLSVKLPSALDVELFLKKYHDFLLESEPFELDINFNINYTDLLNYSYTQNISIYCSYYKENGLARLNSDFHIIADDLDK